MTPALEAAGRRDELPSSPIGFHGAPASAAAIVAVVVVVLLIAALSGPDVVGDGAEYIGMARSILAFGSPAPTPAQADALEAALQRDGLRLQRDALHEGRDGRLYYRHFWLYPALAAPAVGIAAAAGLEPAWGFVLLNALVLALAAVAVAFCSGNRTAALLFLGPILWWTDKPHPEAFTFGLVALGFAAFGRRPGAALLAWAVAAAQYPPLAVLPLCALLLAAWRCPADLRRSRFLAAAVTAGLIAVLHPLYYEWKLGVVTPFVFWGRPAAVPTWREWSAVLTDLDIGLIVNAPFLVAAVLVAAVGVAAGAIGARRAARGGRDAREDGMPEVTEAESGVPRTGRDADAGSAMRRRRTGVALGTAAVAALALPVAFAQTVNVNHGATPGMSRYALWLIPLSIPVLDTLRGPRPPRRFDRVVTALVLLSVVWSALFFRPSLPESYTEPSRLAGWVWTRMPHLSAPLPEVFSERTRGREPGTLPATTPACEKVLLLAGRWPAPCAPVAVPAACKGAGVLCYADRDSRPGAYEFRPLAEPPQAGYAVRAESWPAAHEKTVVAALERLRWWEMPRTSLTDPGSIVRAAHQIDWTAWRSGPGRFFLYAAGVTPGGGASLTLRLPEPMSGDFYDAATGMAVGSVSSPGAGEAWNVAVPETRDGAAILMLTTPGFAPNR